MTAMGERVPALPAEMGWAILAVLLEREGGDVMLSPGEWDRVRDGMYPGHAPRIRVFEGGAGVPALVQLAREEEIEGEVVS